jgi:hypothetical protein
MTVITISGTAVPPSTVNTVTFSSTPAFNAALGQFQQITLTANVTSSTFINAVIGFYTFRITQNATGGFTFVPPTNCLGFMSVGTGANEVSSQTGYYDGTNWSATSPGEIR